MKAVQALVLAALATSLMTASEARAGTPDAIIEGGKASGAIPTVAFPPHGGRGDASFEDRCPAGRYMVGLGVRTGAWMDQLTVICSAVGSDGRTSGNQYLRPRGGLGGGPSERNCAPDHVVNQIKFRMTRGDRQVKSITVECRRAVGSGSQGFRVGGPLDDGNIGSFVDHRCPPGDAAVGMQGRFGNHVNAIGLICARLVLPRAPVAANPPPGDCPPHQIMRRNGTCGCPSGMRGPRCDEIILN
jgi:hypothetical protein